MNFTAPGLRVSESARIAVFEARTERALAGALFNFMAEAMVQEVLFLMLRPIEFELPSFCSRPEFQAICDYHIAEGHNDDIWLQRSPKTPDVTVVRHSLYTPREDFRKSPFYHRVMKNIGCEYGASLVAFHGEGWLASLTIFRTEEQGDFRDDEVPMLADCQLNFQAVINAFAERKEHDLGSLSLENFIWNLPTAAVLLDWSLKPLYWNAWGKELASEWKNGLRVTATKRARAVGLPQDIAFAIEERRSALVTAKSNRPGTPNMMFLLNMKHAGTDELSAEICFMPAKSLAVTKGAFLVVFHRHHDTPDEQESYDRFAKLSPRIREVVLLAVAGYSGPDIAKKLGTSHWTVKKQLHNAYVALEAKSRDQLVAMYSKNSLMHSFFSSNLVT
jgi:DNA-binding CsgD family transcriptional regulator